VILESIVTSVDQHGQVNIAPMGPTVNPDEFVSNDGRPTFTLRPFDSSQTFQNLLATRKAVIHVTDDADLFAKAAVNAIEQSAIANLVRQIEATDWWPLRDCHRWFAVEVTSVSAERPRVTMECQVIQSGIVRPFFGFNRAKHAVIEAAILATRTHLLAASEIDSQLERLIPLVEKTGGPAEHEAFAFLRRAIDSRLNRVQ
jgi:uncharacterized protein